MCKTKKEHKEKVGKAEEAFMLESAKLRTEELKEDSLEKFKQAYGEYLRVRLECAHSR